MSVKGFRLKDGTTEKYDYEALDNLPVIPSGSGLSDEAKQALLALLEKVAYIDENGQTYYNALETALYPPANLVSISAVYTQIGPVYDTASLDDLKTDLVVTAHWSDNTTSTVTTYMLSGTLTEGTSTITVSYGGKTTTFNVTVTHAPTMYTILNNLTDVVNSNSATSIAENAQYSATLTPSANYRLSTVNVTMGAVDITSAVYSNGVITIAAATGNIVITAVAVEDVPVSGPDAWYDGVNYAFREGTVPNTYIIGSTGVETTYNGWSSSDYMKCEGASTLTYNMSTPYGAWYDSNKQCIGECKLSEKAPGLINVPANAAYFRTSWADVGTSSPYVIEDNWYITPNA